MYVILPIQTMDSSSARVALTVTGALILSPFKPFDASAAGLTVSGGFGKHPKKPMAFFGGGLISVSNRFVEQCNRQILLSPRKSHSMSTTAVNSAFLSWPCLSAIASSFSIKSCIKASSSLLGLQLLTPAWRKSPVKTQPFADTTTRNSFSRTISSSSPGSPWMTLHCFWSGLDKVKSKRRQSIVRRMDDWTSS